MTGKANAGRTAALILACMLVFVSIFAAGSTDTYAAAKKPAKVTGLKAKVISSSSIKLTWKKAKNAKKYVIYRAASKNGKYKKIATVKKLNYTNKKLKTNKKYFYKVRALNNKKYGAYSKKVSAKTAALSDIIVNGNTVTLSAKVNGDYFTTSTRHLMIDQKGFNAGKAILTSYCHPDDLYNALVKAGGTSWSGSRDKDLRNGEKISKSNAENKNYSRIDIKISFDGETHSLSECLTTKRGGKITPDINMVFGGNPKAAAKTPSGCMICLDSCYIGIVSNDQYGLCVIDEGKPTVFARADVLPKDGSVVDVVLTVK